MDEWSMYLCDVGKGWEIEHVQHQYDWVIYDDYP